MKGVFNMKRDTYNEWLVKFTDCKNENNMIGSYFTDTPSEILKTYAIAKDLDMDTFIYEDREDNDTEVKIDNIEVHLANDKTGALNCIEVYCEVI